MSSSRFDPTLPSGAVDLSKPVSFSLLFSNVFENSVRPAVMRIASTACHAAHVTDSQVVAHAVFEKTPELSKTVLDARILHGAGAASVLDEAIGRVQVADILNDLNFYFSNRNNLAGAGGAAPAEKAVLPVVETPVWSPRVVSCTQVEDKSDNSNDNNANPGDAGTIGPGSATPGRGRTIFVAGAAAPSGPAPMAPAPTAPSGSSQKDNPGDGLVRLAVEVDRLSRARDSLHRQTKSEEHAWLSQCANAVTAFLGQRVLAAVLEHFGQRAGNATSFSRSNALLSSRAAISAKDLSAAGVGARRLAHFRADCEESIGTQLPTAQLWNLLATVLPATVGAYADSWGDYNASPFIVAVETMTWTQLTERVVGWAHSAQMAVGRSAGGARVAAVVADVSAAPTLAPQRTAPPPGDTWCKYCQQLTDHDKPHCPRYTCRGCRRKGPGHTYPNCPNPTFGAFVPRSGSASVPR